MSEETMRYDLLAQEAMRGVIRLALLRAASPEGLPGNHHLYITFSTRHEGVALPPRLRDEYPDEMTIVLKKHYWDLVVGNDDFSVGLSFHGRHENIRVPYAAVVRFFDPVAQFVLQFPRSEKQLGRIAAADDSPPRTSENEAEVVSLDAFRKR